jgi:hypothetical protein
MERRSSSLSPFHRRLIYLAVTLLWISGGLWWYWQISNSPDDLLEAGVRSRQTLALRVHGAAAILFLVVFGTLFPIHMRSGWRQKKNRASGGFLVSVLLALIATGWGLYYIGYEALRPAMSFVHTYLGLLLPLIIYLHVLFSRRYKTPYSSHSSHPHS